MDKVGAPWDSYLAERRMGGLSSTPEPDGRVWPALPVPPTMPPGPYRGGEERAPGERMDAIQKPTNPRGDL
jgi:hypothetical protein